MVGVRELPDLGVKPTNVSIPMELWKAADGGDEASCRAVAQTAARGNLSFVSAAQAKGIELVARVQSGSIGLVVYFEPKTD